MHVTFDEYYPRNIGKCFSFHDAGVSLEDILKDIEKGIDQPEAVKVEEEENEILKRRRMRIQLNGTIFLWLGGLLRTIKSITFLEISPKAWQHAISNLCYHSAFISQVEPRNTKDALIDEHWLLGRQDELNQFKINDVWDLVPPPRDYEIIDTKLVFRNKLDKDGVIIRNKARVVAQGYNNEGA